MWNLAILAVLMSVAGVYAVRNAASLDGARGQLAAVAAAEMGIYRNAVVAYFTANDLRETRVATGTLKSGGYLPAWSRLYNQATPLTWNNYRDANGVIYVYANTQPERDLSAELARLARNSVLVGVYRSGSPTLQSPATGDTGIPIGPIAAQGIPDGAPVWIAMTQ